MQALRISDIKSWIRENDVQIVVSLALIAWCSYRIDGWDEDAGDLADLIVNILMPIAIVLIAIVRFKLQIHGLIVRDARVLVCSLGDHPALVENVERDAEVYRSHFPDVEVVRASKLADLLTTLSAGDFRVLHIVSEFAGDGLMVEAQGGRAEVASLFRLCREKKLLFAFFGGEIPDENQRAVFDRARAARIRRDVPLIITTARRAGFSFFLDELLRWLDKGVGLEKAWFLARPRDASPGAPQPASDPGPEVHLLR